MGRNDGRQIRYWPKTSFTSSSLFELAPENKREEFVSHPEERGVGRNDGRQISYLPKTLITSLSLAELAPENERKNSLVTLERGEREETNGTGKKISTTRVEVE